MSVTISLLKQACENLQIQYKDIDSAGVFLKVFFDTKNHLFIANNLGLNSELVEKICRDKSYSHQLLSQKIRMPTTATYVDPESPEIYKGFSQFKSQTAVISDIVKNNSFPMILKPNSKSMGVNVFFCEDELSLKNAVTTIWNKKSYKYDHVLLVQEFIKIAKEYRVTVLNKKIELVYQKDNTSDRAQFSGNLSPLHFENAQAVFLDPDISVDQKTIQKLQKFIEPIFVELDLQYGGLDIAFDINEKIHLLEINSKPGYSYFVKDNGPEKVVKLFEKVLQSLPRK